jgi:ATP-dependent Clp protease protease subunit
MRALLEKMIADNTGKSIEEVSRDIERDKILTAQEAVEYGLVDQVLVSAAADTPTGERR